MVRWSVAALGLSLMLLPLAGAQEPGPEVPRWEMRGDAGTPVAPMCAPDGPEMAGAQPDGTMFLPHEGCSAAYGMEDTNGSVPLSIHYKVTGHVGEICGHFTFNGSFVGASAPTCTSHDGVTRMPVHVVAGNGTDLVITWHPTSMEFDNAYLCSLTMAGEPPVPLAESIDCFAGTGTGTTTGNIPPEAEVPFFPGATALLLGCLGAIAAAVILVRRK